MARLRAVHPRACGERSRCRKDVSGGVRFIPAPAGTARGRAASSTGAAVHPRACGERCISRSRISISAGSSPRLRGTRQRLAVLALDQRFIPAPAGNATWTCQPERPLPVHPRACGERARTAFRGPDQAGSSPRLRGTLCLVHADNLGGRFIPAPAGNARSQPTQKLRKSVHPRACGERIHRQHPDTGDVGSSPRLRGTRQSWSWSPARSRFIPAPAGNASIPWRVPAPLAVHPRACGERECTVGVVYECFGSSPRLRGTPWCSACCSCQARFIPAPAGNAGSGS